MRHMFGGIAAIVLSAGYAQAQWNWCPTCYVAGHVDTPGVDGAAYPGYVAGWGFECESGAGVDRIDVYYTDDAAPSGIRRVKDYVIYFAQDRPDVESAFLKSCPHVHSNTGWAVYPLTPIPSGHRRLWVVMWKASIAVTQSRMVDIP